MFARRNAGRKQRRHALKAQLKAQGVSETHLAGKSCKELEAMLSGRPQQRLPLRPKRKASRKTRPSSSTADYTLIPDLDPDENYEIALSEDGVMQYKLFGPAHSPPPGWHSGTTLVAVGMKYDGSFVVYLVDEEDVRAQRAFHPTKDQETAESAAYSLTHH